MANFKSFAVWNNKGGVGKSTIVFHVATRYAEQNPDETVIVIDLCPQANASMMLLGGGVAGENAVLGYGTQAVPRTVVGYLSTVIAQGAGAPMPNAQDFLVQVSATNRSVAPNVLLLCGDGNLEPMAPAIVQAANAPALMPSIQPWQWVHLVFRRLVEDLASQPDSRDVTVFVDTNPSFSIYTELAISTADYLIVPVNADDSSRVATNAMFILLHGQTPPHPVYGNWTFAAQAQNHGITIPQIHVIVGNRLTQHVGAATAFEALSDATADTLFAQYRRHPQYFTSRQGSIGGIAAFRDQFSVSLRDFNTAGVVAAHLGRPLSKLPGGYHDVHGHQVQVNAARVEECEAALDDLLAFI
ncbi:ParA family protein [Burkholderia ubonensis]|uniref:ParA family protein n=1 Tax=Burkholderia ubonensis TaxID=101571 RepID=UPI0009B3D578|nr:ParA family protein [Burkholderia ubonensis]